MLFNLDINSQVSYVLVMPGVWSPLIVICKTNTHSLKIWVALSNFSWMQTKNLSCSFMFDWKYEWICPTFLESKPGVFQAVSCFMFNWKYEWLCQTFLESKPGVFHVVSCLIEIPDTRNAIFESVEHACLASEVWSVPPENIFDFFEQYL